MDILAVVGFGIVMLNTLRLKGYTEHAVQLKAIIYICLVAGLLLCSIYGGLAYLGATSSMTLSHDLNQAQLIVAITHYLLGSTGTLVLGIIVGFACLTTAIGLAGATAYFFEKISGGKVKYEIWIVVNILISTALCNLGLTSIIELAVPILTTICPPFMITVILLLFRNHIKNNMIYKVCAFIGLIFGLYFTIQSYI